MKLLIDGWELTQPCNSCYITKCKGPCDKYDKWLAKNPDKPPKKQKYCSKCGQPI